MEATQGERRWAMLAHVLTLLGLVIPLADLLVPAVLGWSKRGSEYVRFHARSSLRFQVSCLILELAGLACLGACHLAIESQIDGPRFGLMLLALAGVSLVALGLVWTVTVTCLALYAGAQALAGIRYRYPLTLKFLG
ncbi:MAG: DUF4870 domain-containing protein [Candidatus Tectomicrobia bacterium]|nr:DUF4870 domain-containing protein [Candidatus Tectomicrobia bacterium]